MDYEYINLLNDHDSEENGIIPHTLDDIHTGIDGGIIFINSKDSIEQTIQEVLGASDKEGLSELIRGNDDGGEQNEGLISTVNNLKTSVIDLKNSVGSSDDTEENTIWGKLNETDNDLDKINQAFTITITDNNESEEQQQETEEEQQETEKDISITINGKTKYLLNLKQADENLDINSDLNEIINPGVYSVEDNNIAKQIKNIPIRTKGTLRVFKQSGNGKDEEEVIQEFINYMGEKSVRYQSGINAINGKPEWSEWTGSGIKGYRQGNSPSWDVILANNNTIMASVNLYDQEFEASGDYDGKWSKFRYLSLPYPMIRSTLTGAANKLGIIVINPIPDGAAGMKYRLQLPSFVNLDSIPVDNRHFSIRFQLMGELKKPNKNPNELIPPLNDEENALDEAIRNKVIEIADTYWKQAKGNYNQETHTWEQPKRKFVYGKNWTNTDNVEDPRTLEVNDESGKGRIVCDTLITLVLRGLAYKDSPYGKKGIGIDRTTLNPLNNAKFSHEDLPSNYNQYKWVERLNSLLLGKKEKILDELEGREQYIGTPKYYYTTYTGNHAKTEMNKPHRTINENEIQDLNSVNVEEEYSSYDTISVNGAELTDIYDYPGQDSYTSKYYQSNRRFTYQLLWAFWQQKDWVYSDVYDEYGNLNLKKGDLAFWVEHDNIRKKYFDGVSHAALIDIVEENGVSVPYIYEATYYSLDDGKEYQGNVIQKIKLSEKVPQPSYYVRMDYLGKSYITEEEQDDGGSNYDDESEDT